MNQWKGRAKVFSLMLFVLFLWTGLQPFLSLGQKAKAEENGTARGREDTAPANPPGHEEL
ncbi:MAG: hypothetical protein Q8O04_03780 [Deltaproteobacteria bacterium]|nr:hypothetical protein [Deltaproteobacteria bacterium]